MYDYTYDPETGGLLLNDKTALMSKEPRPVYAQELDFLGIDTIWQYEKQQDVPYMWAEANHYIYKGKTIFNTSGGSLYVKPTVDIVCLKDDNGKPTTQVLAPGTVLEPVNLDLMCQKNRILMDIIEQVTVKKIYEVYKRRQKSLDCFHVAFSGGKDSVVLLELVKKALPRSGFMVVFGDTKMEFPDTYALVDKVEAQCKAANIDFYRASTHFEPEESWRLFGPPSRVLRWCCSVHKAAPQTLKIREVLGKNDYVGLDFVGVRAQESATRSGYDVENYGKKQKGQYSHNSILEWSSAEVWLYIFTHNLPINDAYKKGNSRAGCLFCPMSTGRSPAFQHITYPAEVDNYIDLVKELVDDRDMVSYVCNGGFNSRRSGRDLINNQMKYFESKKGDKIELSITNASSNWFEWKKTIAHLHFVYEERVSKNGVTIIADAERNRLGEYKLLKQALKKSAYCVGCRVCEANCPFGALKFDASGVHVEGCHHCEACHALPNGCLVAESRKKPSGEKKMKSVVNCFDSHAPKSEWVIEFFARKNEFLVENSLGPNQMKAFKRFLKGASLIDSKAKSITPLATKLSAYSWNSETTWGIMFVELVYNNPQIAWYVNNMSLNATYSRVSLSEKLTDAGETKNNVDFIISAYKRLCELPLGVVLHFGEVTVKGRQVNTATRTKTILKDDRVLLYSLYRYAEACGGYYQFSLDTLMDISIQSEGISPVKIFGFTRDEMEAMLRGLAAKYNAYIDVTFTHDLDKITLRDYHSTADVLELF